MVWICLEFIWIMHATFYCQKLKVNVSAKQILKIDKNIIIIIKNEVLKYCT
jgi:hypothetical protein